MMSKGWKKTKCSPKRVRPLGPQRRPREPSLSFQQGLPPSPRGPWQPFISRSNNALDVPQQADPCADPCFPPPAPRSACYSKVSAREAEAGGLEGQGHPLLHSTFQTSLGFMKIYLKTNKQAHKPTKHTSKPTDLDQLWQTWPWASCEGQLQLQLQPGMPWRAQDPGLAQVRLSSRLSDASAFYSQLLLFLCTPHPWVYFVPPSLGVCGCFPLA